MQTDQTEARIYLADQRGCSQLDWFRSFHVFNFGSYQNEDRTPFDRLVLFNDDTLKAGATLQLQVGESMHVLLLPVVGGVEFSTDTGEPCFAAAGQVIHVKAEAGLSYQITNPYEEELVNVLQIWIRGDDILQSSVSIEELNLAIRNDLISVCSATDFSIRMGTYEGRTDGIFSVYGSHVFVWVVEGAFEVQNRLMETRDGLALSRIEELEFEALSNNAILLVLEW